MRAIILVMAFWGSTCLLHSQIQNQSITLEGKVVDMDDDRNIDYFNFEAIEDSTVVLQGSSVDGKFTIQLPGRKRYKLKISSMGYEDNFIDIDGYRKSMDTLVCRVKKKAIELNEVVVTSIKPKSQ